MAAFRILNQFPVYLDQSGQPASGGELRFYESGTTTPKSVYGDPELTIDNGSTVLLNSDGRTAVDVWGDGAYRVRLYDADGTQLAEADDVEVAGGSGTAIPALVDGYFLTNNGALLLWAPIREMPDPTGQDGKYPVASGSGYVLQSPPEPPEIPDPDIVVGDATFQAGVSDDITKFYIQTGTGSAPASGTRRTNASVEFDDAFGVLWHVSVTQKHGGVTSNSFIPTQSVSTQSVNGFTVDFSTDENSTSGDWNIINPVPFSWMAVGTINVADIPATP